MIADFEDFVTWMYVIVDDCWKQIAWQYRRPGPEPRSCSDSELITIALVSECRAWCRETHLIAEWKAYKPLFPRLPERSRFNRRRRNLMQAINQIRQIVLSLLDLAQDAYGAIDSLPVPVMMFHLAPQRSREWDVAGASFGYCASKKQTFFGYRLHILVTLGGVIVDFELTAANADERESAQDLLANQAGRTFLGDKGYVGADLAGRLREQAQVRLVALRRVNQHAPLPEALTRLVKRFRQIIETVNSQLAEQFLLQHNDAHSFSGLCARLYTKLAAHTICIYLNRLLGNPDWLRIKKLAFPN